MTIHTKRSYLQKHRALPRQLDVPPAADLGLLVVIPCHAEPDLLGTLDSLEACQPPACGVEVLVVLNAGTQHPPAVHTQNARTAADVIDWQAQPRRYRYHLIRAEALRPKHAGVGLARKIGFDEAIDRLEQAGQPDGLLSGLDADCRVAPTYLRAIVEWFGRHPRHDAASLFFEHPLTGSSYPPAVYAGIARYELYLRYYVQGLRWAGYPLAHHCVGSSMAVRASAYQAQNGMNRRKAGEDYYFLHKFMLLGTLGDLTETTVYPAPRPSEKVPFGTGRAIRQWLASEQAVYRAFDLRSFAALGGLVTGLPALYADQTPPLDPVLVDFLAQQGLAARLPAMRQHSAGEAGFAKRFWAWFDGLKALQFMHHARDAAYPDLPVEQVAAALYQTVRGETVPVEVELLLRRYRAWERGGWWKGLRVEG